MIIKCRDGSFKEDHYPGMFTVFWNADGSYRGQEHPNMMDDESPTLFFGPNRDGGPVKRLGLIRRLFASKE